jgi:hypothetical protein
MKKYKGKMMVVLYVCAKVFFQANGIVDLMM